VLIFDLNLDSDAAQVLTFEVILIVAFLIWCFSVIFIFLWRIVRDARTRSVLSRTSAVRIDKNQNLEVSPTWMNLAEATLTTNPLKNALRVP
jgi:hypothetical protein